MELGAPRVVQHGRVVEDLLVRGRLRSGPGAESEPSAPHSAAAPARAPRRGVRTWLIRLPAVTESMLCLTPTFPAAKEYPYISRTQPKLSFASASSSIATVNSSHSGTSVRRLSRSTITGHGPVPGTFLMSVLAAKRASAFAPSVALL